MHGSARRGSVNSTVTNASAFLARANCGFGVNSLVENIGVTFPPTLQR
jgi:hypothetical protein